MNNKQLRWLFLFVVLACTATMATLTVVLDQRSRARDRTLRMTTATLEHFCTLEQVTDAVWLSAIASYTSLPNKTAGQKKLLAELIKGDAEVQSDRTCPALQRRSR